MHRPVISQFIFTSVDAISSCSIMILLVVMVKVMAAVVGRDDRYDSNRCDSGDG